MLISFNNPCEQLSLLDIIARKKTQPLQMQHVYPAVDSPIIPFSIAGSILLAVKLNQAVVATMTIGI